MTLLQFFEKFIGSCWKYFWELNSNLQAESVSQSFTEIEKTREAVARVLRQDKDELRQDKDASNGVEDSSKGAEDDEWSADQWAQYYEETRKKVLEPWIRRHRNDLWHNCWWTCCFRREC